MILICFVIDFLYENDYPIFIFIKIFIFFQKNTGIFNLLLIIHINFIFLACRLLFHNLQKRKEITK
jgi:hypothetical protein